MYPDRKPAGKSLPSFCIGGTAPCTSPASSFRHRRHPHRHGEKRITERTLDALRRLQQNGILLAVATGRSPLIVPKFDGVEFDVFLTYNGSYCYDRRGDIFASPIPPQDVQTLIQNAAALGRPVSVAGRTQLLSNGTDDDLTAYYAIGGRAPVISDKFDEVSRGEVSSC